MKSPELFLTNRTNWSKEQFTFYRTGHILDDQDLVETLKKSKVMSAEMRVRVEQSEEAEKKLNHARQKYLPVSNLPLEVNFTVQDVQSFRANGNILKECGVVLGCNVVLGAGQKFLNILMLFFSGCNQRCGFVLCVGWFGRRRHHVPVFTDVVSEHVCIVHQYVSPARASEKTTE